MWYVKNESNGNRLGAFEKKVIIPLFSYMVIYKRKSETQSFISFLACELKKCNKDLKEYKKRIKRFSYESLALNIDVVEEQIHVIRVLKYVSNTKNKGKYLYKYINDLLRKCSLSELQNEIAIYYKHKKELKGKFTYVKDYSDKINSEWRIIFVEFFYSKLFDRKKMWKLIDGAGYDRSMFHDNFCKDNDLYVCPYCDSIRIIDSGIVDIDHFWPSSKYPFLAMNAMNMLSCCKACNSVSSGKGDKVYKPMTMPTYYPIDKKVHFCPDVINERIDVKGKDNATKNYVLLIRLSERYSKPRYYKFLQDHMAGIYTTIIDAEIYGESICNEDIERYISKTMHPKRDPFYFATKDVLTSYYKYIDYLSK